MEPSVPPAAPPRSARAWLAGLVLVATIFLAYARVWHAGFIWDDDDHLTRNPCIVGPLGFGAIWTSSKAVYYPLVLTSFWVQHAIWGLNPLPYHVVDVALHAVCAVLLWRVLRRMNIAGAWLGATLWALHPVQVESAAWITEQKNTQSGVFYLLAILFFLRWIEARNEVMRAGGQLKPGFPRARNYAMALLCAMLAILSKSSTVMLPVVLGLCWWWVDGRWRWGQAVWLGPFAMVSGLASAWTVWEQKYAHNALGAAWSQTWVQRAVIAGKDIWFYLWKLAWPHPLTFIYTRWDTDATRPVAWAPLIGVGCALFLLWLGRNGKLRPVFFAAAYFVVSLFPVLNFFNVYFFRYSFVGDHFQYLASMGPLALAGAGIATACRSGSGESRMLLYRVVSAALLLVLGGLTWLQCGVYYNLETLWRATLADNPDAWIAHYNLADVLVKEGHLGEAEEHYRAQLQLLPRSEEGMGNLATVLMMEGRTNDGIAEFEQLLTIDPGSALAHANLSVAMLREGRVNEAIEHAQQAVALSRHTDEETGEGHNDPTMLRVLAQAYARAGRYAEAIQAAKMALQRAQSESDMPLAAALSRELQLYEAGGKAAP
ncbi:MAG: tetratricopeptide repeat protein [Chthoniobacteraceae bacterium]|jgi:tetratricopeptide (TPR) repeat protein